MKPHILLSVSQNAHANYTAAFMKYGFDVSFSYCPQDFGYDGLVLCGGGDIDAAYYGKPRGPSYPPDICRDRSEFALFEKYNLYNKPIFGICRGMQLINVAMGGTLIRHLLTSRDHTRLEDCDSMHKVQNLNGTFLHKVYGPEMITNSAHHQGCETIAQQLSVVQRHSDGTIEGIAGKNILAVQWHPERMIGECRKRFLCSDPAAVFEYYRNMF